MTSSARSRNMSAIRLRDTIPEWRVRKALHAEGLRYRLHASELAGTPDIVLPRWNTVVFVHGCFWHRHRSCRFAATPKTNVAFWRAKFSANIRRDTAVQHSLRRQGWRVFVIWECQAAKPRFLAGLAQRIKA